jgi:hypothetical protein
MNPSIELARMSATAPSGNWNFTDSDRTLGLPSCTSGLPLAFEKRMTIGTGPPCRWGGRLTRRASCDALNAPEQTMPLAWAGRKPGWEPASSRMVSTISATRVFSVLYVDKRKSVKQGEITTRCPNTHAAHRLKAPV